MTLSQARTYQGQCHCGAIRVRLELTRPAGEIDVRACQCSFCTRHGAMTVSDADGRAVFEIDRDRLASYQFATRGGTVLLCRVCGVYAGMALEVDGNTWSIANVRGLAIPEFKGAKPRPVVYDEETREARIARRKRMWTPTEIRQRGA
jgi:hypothetical protein